ncbi:MAG TPA: DNA polymerase III subunit delta' [Gammaproteobacteria bacterium]|nr:DNA polymerase III subunit delta' [Gammaproteobacteria bacterium]
MFTWLNKPWQQLGQARVQGRLPHALLIKGQDGVGKRVLAEQLAAALICEKPDSGGYPCGHCQSCGWLQAGTHPDLLRVTPEEAGKAIKIDQIRALNAALVMTSHAGRYKVAIIQPADAMNRNAANALLKTLEEPAANTLLLLLTAAAGRLPATIRSRCQQLAVELPDTDSAQRWLVSEGVDADNSVLYLKMAHGAPLQARRMAGAADSGVRGQRLDQLQAIFAGQLDPVQTAKDWEEESGSQTLQWWRVWLQELVRWQVAGQQPPEADVAHKLQRIVETVDCRQLFELSDRVTGALNAAGSGLNRQMMLEDLLISWAKLANQASTRTVAGNR